MAEERVLLPTSLVPSRYSVHLTPDLKAFTFKGTVSVDVNVKEATNQVILHSLDIKIEQATFVPSGGSAVKAKDITYQAAEETATLHFEDNIKVGAGKLDIEFEGELNNKMMGFYRSKYFVNGEERYMGTTQFEPTGARRAFPCWDEPAIKAVFEIVLSVPEHLLPLSNMEPVDSQVKDGIKTVKFAPSPIMSTYLVAFIVGEFDSVEGQTKEGTKVRVYTPLGRSSQGVFAKDVAVNCLSYYNEYYGIPYPLPKLDMIAIADFAAGAMENWGLVTYRETALLIDEKNSGVAAKQRVAYVVAHELAHQWFGNLVTMEWWKELWLNEGFATFVGNQAVVHLFPAWDIWTQFVSQYVNRALDLDSLESSHPIEVEVKNSAQIEEIFDAISYCKGASVIRMISDRVGEDAFRKGLNVYLNRHKYSNAVTEDLWKALSEASGFDVGTFMNAFTKSTGYPVVSVEGTSKPDEFTLQQTRFFSDGKIQTGPDAQKWWVSIGVRTSNSKEISTHDLKDQKATVNLPVAGAEWFKVNADQSGFYRVKYTSDILSKLSAAVSSLALPAVDRIGLQNDAFALAKAGMLPTADALTLAKGYINEVDYTVWSDLASNLDGMSIVWSSEPNHKELETFIRTLFTPIGKKLGWDPKPGESDLDTLLRAVTLNQLSATGDKDTIAEARKRFDAYEKNPESLPADLRFIVYKSLVVYGNKDDYERVLKIFRTADLHEEKLRALRALAYSRDPELITRSLELSLTEVREQDIFYVIASCSTHSQARKMSWDFLRSNWAEFNKKLGSTAMLMDRLIQYATRGFASEEAAKSIREFFAANPVPAADRTIKQSLETILGSAKWLEINRESVAKWLKENQ